MRVFTGFFSALLSGILYAATPIDGLYMNIFGGVTYLPDNVNSIYKGLHRNNALYNSGWDAGGSFGFKGNRLRYEGQLTYLEADARQFSLNSVRQPETQGYAKGVFAMANVYYDFCPFTPTFEPYIGAGVGYGWVRAKLNTPDIPPEYRWKGDNSVFAYQGMTGLTYNFAENYALFIEYRYLTTEKAQDLGKLFQTHMGNVGAVYRFEINRYK